MLYEKLIELVQHIIEFFYHLHTKTLSYFLELNLEVNARASILALPPFFVL